MHVMCHMRRRIHWLRTCFCTRARTHTHTHTQTHKVHLLLVGARDRGQREAMLFSFFSDPCECAQHGAAACRCFF